MMAEPPSNAGAAHVTVAEASAAAAATPVGASEIVIGVTALDCADNGPVPAALVAVTENVYVAPLARPEIVAVSSPAVETINPPGLEVTV